MKLTYEDLLNRLAILKIKITKNALQKYIHVGLLDEPAIEGRGGQAQFSTQAPLQAYAAHMLMRAHRLPGTIVKDAKEICEYLERAKYNVDTIEGMNQLFQDKTLAEKVKNKATGVFFAPRWLQYILEAVNRLRGSKELDKGERGDYIQIYVDSWPAEQILKKQHHYLVGLAEGIIKPGDIGPIEIRWTEGKEKEEPQNNASNH
jgi:hypothetical protein